MKKLTGIFAAFVLIGFTGAALGEVVIREISLDWEQVAKLEGDVLYDNLCASCHGVGGKGDGPASGALEKAVPNLTIIAINNGGEFAHNEVESVIFGDARTRSHGTIDMPAWGHQFMYLRPGWSSFTRKAYARERIHTLTDHIESLQQVAYVE